MSLATFALSRTDLPQYVGSKYHAKIGVLGFMRLTCPNCDAQYEVPDDVIPAEGRDVQCSNCGMTWFQDHPDQAKLASDAPDETGDEEEWAPEVPTEETLQDAVEDTPEEVEDAVEDASPSLAASAPDAVLAEAVKAALVRARETSAPQEESKVPSDDESEDSVAETADFEAELDASLDDMSEAEASDIETDEDAVYFEHHADPEPEEVDAAPVQAPKETRRRTIDPTVANILQEEAALEAERRADETRIESQPDLGLEEPSEDAAKRARQARERMARMRGMSPEEAERPVEPIPENSRRDLLPDIEEINSTLRATEDRAPDEQPDGRPTLTQRRAGGRRMGFALALLLIAIIAVIYTNPTLVTDNVPGSEGLVAGLIETVDRARLGLDQQMTKLRLWVEGLTSAG